MFKNSGSGAAYTGHTGNSLRQEGRTLPEKVNALRKNGSATCMQVPQNQQSFSSVNNTAVLKIFLHFALTNGVSYTIEIVDSEVTLLTLRSHQHC
jgi:hypothetical protein